MFGPKPPPTLPTLLDNAQTIDILGYSLKKSDYLY